MVNSEEPGNISQATFDSYEALLVEAQEEVARRLSDRLDEFVTLQ
jgi:hypothetical protein